MLKNALKYMLNPIIKSKKFLKNMPYLTIQDQSHFIIIYGKYTYTRLTLSMIFTIRIKDFGEYTKPKFEKYGISL